MKSKQINKSQGFTIIETLIVLAIAATIFLVVFLAVSALNRSSRNTQRKDDAAAVIAAFSDYASNNNGALPGKLAFVAPNLDLCAAIDSSCTATTNTDIVATAKLGYYSGTGTTAGTAGDVNLISAGSGATAPATTTDSLNIYVGATCNGNALTAGSTRSLAALYGTELSSGFSWQCEAS
jgi:prepilin-type N-terminal cleavage/methylation domain-containing protein